jgi:hypothetical protein
MPYNVRKSGSKYVVVSKQTGKVKSHHATKAKAQSSVRAIYANEHKKKA